MMLRPRKISDYLEMIWRRKWVLFLMALVMLIATYYIIRRIPSLYESRALIVINKDIPTTGDFVIPESATFTTVNQLLTSRGNAAALVSRYKLYPKIKDRESAIQTLQKAIKLDVKMRGYYPEGPESMTLAYRYPDPAIAQSVVADLVSNFEQANQQIREHAAGEAERMNSKIVEIENKLKQIAPQQNLEFLRSAAATRAASEAAATRTQRFTVQSSVETLSDKEYALERQINDLKGQIAEAEKNLKSTQSSTPMAGNAAYGALLVRKSEIEAQIKIYQTQYTDKNPKVIAAREQLAGIEREMKRVEASGGAAAVAASTPEAMELKRLKQQLGQFETDLDVTRRDLGRKKQSLDTLAISGAGSIAGVPSPSGSFTESRAEYDRLLIRYNTLNDKQDALMKLAGIAGSGTPMFQIVDTPNRPELPVAPNKLMLMLMAAGLAVGFGLALVFALELPRMFQLNDDQDVEYYLGAPVLAYIPETLTNTERSRDRKVRWMRGLIFLMMAAALVPILILVLNRLQVFQILGSR